MYPAMFILYCVSVNFLTIDYRGDVAYFLKKKQKPRWVNRWSGGLWPALPPSHPSWNCAWTAWWWEARLRAREIQWDETRERLEWACLQIKENSDNLTWMTVSSAPASQAFERTSFAIAVDTMSPGTAVLNISAAPVAEAPEIQTVCAVTEEIWRRRGWE